MFLEYWMIILFVIVAGFWAERRYMVGIRGGVETTLAMLAENKFLKIDEKGHLVPHK
jgi:hypothetical protein